MIVVLNTTQASTPNNKKKFAINKIFVQMDFSMFKNCILF